MSEPAVKQSRLEAERFERCRQADGLDRRAADVQPGDDARDGKGSRPSWID